MDQALIIFVKKPVAGQVKTRLAVHIGEAAALRIYQALLEHTREVVSELNAERYVYYSPDIDQSDKWNEIACTKMLQQGNHLGERMKNAFEEIFSKAHSSALIIGSDCPGLTPAIIEEAFVLLKTHDVVAGPAADGGYYLIGMKNLYPELFKGISWSTPDVFKQTLFKIKSLKASYALLPVLSDIDRPEDLTDELKRMIRDKQ